MANAFRKGSSYSLNPTSILFQSSFMKYCKIYKEVNNPNTLCESQLTRSSSYKPHQNFFPKNSMNIVVHFTNHHDFTKKEDLTYQFDVLLERTVFKHYPESSRKAPKVLTPPPGPRHCTQRYFERSICRFPRSREFHTRAGSASTRPSQADHCSKHKTYRPIFVRQNSFQ